MRKNTSILFFLMMVLASICFHAEGTEAMVNETRYKVSKLEGVPQNDVNCIFQDSRGFIWIGTLDGLHRYDGYIYKTYRTGNKENTINSNLISAIDEDSHGNIWVATFDKGICKLNPTTDEFTDFSNQVRYHENSLIYDVEVMCIDQHDVMWVAHKHNIIRVELNDKLEAVNELTVLLETNSEPKAIYPDSDGQLWVGASHQFIRILNPYAAKKQIKTELFKLHVQSICETENEIIAVGAKLYVFTKSKKDTSGKYALKSFDGISGNKILFDRDRIWVGGRNGVETYTRDELGSWIIDTNFNGDFGSLGLGSNVVFSLLLDPESVVWVGTRGSGVNRIDLNPKRFEHYKHTGNVGSLSNDLVRCVFQDSYGQVWIGTEESGVNILRNPATESFDKNFEHLSVNDNKQADRVYTAVEMSTPGSKEHESLVWLGTSYYTGMVGVNPHTLEIVRQSREMSQVGFAFAMEVYDSMLWVGTYRSGLWRFIMDDRGHVVSSDQFMPDDYEGSVNSDIIRSLLRDSKDNLWVGTDKGLHRVEPGEVTKERPLFKDYTNKTTNTRFGFDHILQIYEDREGKIWVGTMGNGLLSYNQEVLGQEVVFDNITVGDMLPNNTIKSIVEDGEGSLWLATNNGISRFNPANRMVTNYDVADGLQNNEFSEISGKRLKDGRIVMGGINGFNVFNPENIIPDESKPKLLFTELSVNNKLVEPKQKVNGRVLLDKSIEFSNNIELKFKENNFSIGFVGIQFNSANKNNYEYMLEGFDEEWIKTSSQFRLANYTNIPSGKYTFMVNCSNSDNEWCEAPIRLEIQINPPFYRSWGAYVVYALILLISFYFYLQIRKAKEKERSKLLIAEMEKKQVEEMYQMRQQFFTNVSHEFKTPLTLIKGPIESLQNKPNMSEADKQKSYGLIKQNVQILMRLISQLMDFRKLDQNKMKITYSKVAVNGFAEKVFASFESWAEQKQIELSFTPNIVEVYTAFDQNKMEIVLYNIISNAIKNTPSQGKVNVRVEASKSKKEFSIIIGDTGVGIPLNDQPHIFERFYQSTEQSRKNAGGTGIGLAYSKALIELQGGQITFESEEGLGSTFIVSMPIKVIDAIDESDVDVRIEEDISLEKELSGTTATDEQPLIQNDRPTLLVVEDNYDLRHFIAQELGDSFNVVLAEDGIEGLEMVEKYTTDLVISDVMMPKMDGIEMCKRIKENEATSHIPIIMLTSKTSEDAQIEGFDVGADAYVPKPFSIDVFRHRIQSILKNREKLRNQFQKELKINPMIIANTDADVKFMETVLKLIEDNLSDSEFNVDKLAKAYGVSRVYLGRKIKALTGESPIQFQRNIRLKHAAVLIQKSDLTISQVAWDVGYNDISTFRIRFKEHFDLTPTEYRKKFQGTDEG